MTSVLKNFFYSPPSGPGSPHYQGFKITFRHHTQWDSSIQVISPLHRPLPDNTQQSQETDIHAPAGFKPAIPVSGCRPPT